MRILMVGDLVGAPGRRVLSEALPRLRESIGVDFAVVNAENAAGGKGITLKIANSLFDVGADVITLGDHAWDQKELVGQVDQESRLLRPLNFAPGCPGRGTVKIDTAFGPVRVTQVIGRVFMKPNDCPFRAMDRLLAEPDDARVHLVDVHAEATSEKIVLGRYLDGRVTAVVGTHTHVQTADDVILPGGTGYLTDLGMSGVTDSAIGREVAAVTRAFLSGMPTKFDLAKGAAVMHGVWMDVDELTGKVREIRRVREGIEGPALTALG